jgi:hypothetical protein
VTEHGKLVTLALSWFATRAEAETVAGIYKHGLEVAMLQSYRGIYEPSEDPKPAEGNVFHSLSVAQVINQPGIPDNVDAYAGFVILQQPVYEGEKIVLGNNPGSTVFNWLTAFYAIEWTLFAGFAVFLWGRLVKDELIRFRSQ